MKEVFLRGTLELLFSLLVSGFIVFKGGRLLKKNSRLWYGISSLFSLASFLTAGLMFLRIIDLDRSLWWVRVITSIVSGYFPAALFMYVMFGGALKKGSGGRKAIMAIRTELSIIATIFYLPHTILYTVFSAPRSLVALFQGNINIMAQLMTWTGLINGVLLILLGATSPYWVRSKMSFKTWKKIQRWAYLFYFSCFAHYMTLSIWGKHYERSIIYVLIYGTYLVMRLQQAKKDKIQAKILGK